MQNNPNDDVKKIEDKIDILNQLSWLRSLQESERKLRLWGTVQKIYDSEKNVATIKPYKAMEPRGNSVDDDKLNSVLDFILLEIEKGYVNDPEDPGGETKYGITKRSYPTLDIKNLTLDDAKSIYKRDFWFSHNFQALPNKLSVLAFDFGINSGPITAIRMLQSVLDLAADGKIGPLTIKATHKAMPRIATEYLAKRAHFLISLNRPRYNYGWMKRLFMLQAFVENLFPPEPPPMV